MYQDVKGNIIPTQMIDGIEIPIEITKKGWIFDPQRKENKFKANIFLEKVQQ